MEPSFALGMNFYKLFWIFFIGCFLGVVLETLWCLVRNRRLESRTGLIYGPFNLVYGIGALLVTLLLSGLSDKRDLWIILSGMALGGAYEYLCSVLQEKLFGTVSWDYRKFPLNFHGRINLLYCFFWGLLALLWVKDACPRLSRLIERIPKAVGVPFTWALLGFMVFNTVMSALVVYRRSQRERGEAAHSVLDRYLDRHYPDERVKKIYPNMAFATPLEDFSRTQKDKKEDNR